MGDGKLYYDAYFDQTISVDDWSEPGSWRDAMYWRDRIATQRMYLHPGNEQANFKQEVEPPKMSSIEGILAERGKRYGDFIDHAAISQHLKQSMACQGWNELSCDQKEALEMIVHKIARILNGDPNYADSWLDIAGYAKLISDRLERGQ